MHRNRSILALAAAALLCAVMMASHSSPASDDAEPEANPEVDPGADSEGEPGAEPGVQISDSEVAASVISGDDDSEPDTPQRVILRVNRHQEVEGTVEMEDDEVIVVRTLRDEIESFAKIRVLQIVRLVTPEPGQRGVVLLKNGQRREGIILEDTFDHVLVEIEGIPARLRREFVDYVVLEPTFEQRYREFKRSLQPHMHERHLMLCRWLIEHREYELARENLLEILGEEEVYDARQLLRIVEAQLALQAPANDVPSGASEETDSPTPERQPARLLTHDDVNLIRVYEMDFKDPPRITVEPDTVRRLFESYGTHELIPADRNERNAMLRGDPIRLVRLMFELRARELYPEIKVESEPAALNQFRLRVHNNWLLNNCATSGCHGGPDAGEFQLHRSGYADDRVRYTNLLILEELELDPEWPLINYEDPERSLLIQYGLSRDIARKPHPDVPGWTPVFTRRNDRLKQETIRWIEMMMQPRPEYPIEFDPRPWYPAAASSEGEVGGDDDE